jgi:hypothetical protein
VSSESNKRFSITTIRTAIEQKKKEEKNKQLEEKERAKELRLKAAIERQKKDQRDKFFLKHYGRELLEDAIQKYTSVSLFEDSSHTIDISNEAYSRGFSFSYLDDCYFDDLTEEYQEKYRGKFFRTTEDKIAQLDELSQTELRNTLIDKLQKIRNILDSNTHLKTKYPDVAKLEDLIPKQRIDFSGESLLEVIKLCSMITLIPTYLGDKAIEQIHTEIYDLAEIAIKFEDDESLQQVSIEWSYPEENEDSITDCINAKFLDWVSDKYGQQLISNVFFAIENADIDGKRDIHIDVKRKKASSEYTHDEKKNLYEIANTIVPFSMKMFLSMFEILDYQAEFKKYDAEKESVIGQIVLKWSP